MTDTREALMMLAEKASDSLIFDKNYSLNNVHDAIWEKRKELQNEEMYPILLDLSRKTDTKENRKAFIYEAYGWIYASN